MIAPMRTSEGIAVGRFREWVFNSSEEAGHGGIAGAGGMSTLRVSRQDVGAVRYGTDSKIVRPIRYQRLDLEQEPGSRSCAWSKLEPLTES
jgi:hypothetical protein